MQSFIDFPDTDTLTASRPEILNNDKTIMSCSSGTTFPTENLQVGMLCMRIDLLKLYQLTALTPTWVCIADLTTRSPAAAKRLSRTQLHNNTTLESGIYQNTGDGLGDPSNTSTPQLPNWWHVVHMHHAEPTGYDAQLAFGTADSAGKVAFRYSTGGVWSNWLKVWTELSDGSGSGLDADLLDGRDYTFFLNASNFNAGVIGAALLPLADTATRGAVIIADQATVNGLANTSRPVTPGTLAPLLANKANTSGTYGGIVAGRANTLSQNGSGGAMTFNWSGQSGQPTWVWGSNDGANHYVYNPRNFVVETATFALTCFATGSPGNIVGSRFFNTKYWNGTYATKIIFVTVQSSSGWRNVWGYVNDAEVCAHAAIESSSRGVITLIVPPGASYQVNTAGGLVIVTWHEQ